MSERRERSPDPITRWLGDVGTPPPRGAYRNYDTAEFLRELNDVIGDGDEWYDGAYQRAPDVPRDRLPSRQRIDDPTWTEARIALDARRYGGWVAYALSRYDALSIEEWPTCDCVCCAEDNVVQPQTDETCSVLRYCSERAHGRRRILGMLLDAQTRTGQPTPSITSTPERPYVEFVPDEGQRQVIEARLLRITPIPESSE